MLLKHEAKKVYTKMTHCRTAPFGIGRDSKASEERMDRVLRRLGSSCRWCDGLTAAANHAKQAVKVICKKAASPPHMNGSIVFVRWRQCAPHLIRASLNPFQSTSETVDWLVQPFCTAHGKQSLYITMGRPFPHKLAPSQGLSGPPI